MSEKMFIRIFDIREKKRRCMFFVISRNQITTQIWDIIMFSIASKWLIALSHEITIIPVCFKKQFALKCNSYKRSVGVIALFPTNAIFLLHNLDHPLCRDERECFLVISEATMRCIPLTLTLRGRLTAVIFRLQ